MGQPSRFPPELVAQLDMPEGTMRVGLTLGVPLGQPPTERQTLVAGETPEAKTAIRIDLDENLRIHFVRQAPGGDPADVGIDVTPLLGANKLDVWCAWSPLAMDIHVVDRDQPQRMVTSES
jgi:hypothetical protein